MSADEDVASPPTTDDEGEGEYVNTTQNPADLLTKALERESFERHRAV
jgi:hypothetical protein